MTNADRRKNPRIRIALEVAITSGSNFYAGRTRDVSEGGVFVETTIALPIGAAIDVELTLAGSRHVVRGEVAWVLEHGDGTVEGVGVQFVAPCPRTRAAIAHFMARRSPMPFEIEEPGAPAQVPPGPPARRPRRRNRPRTRPSPAPSAAR